MNRGDTAKWDINKRRKKEGGRNEKLEWPLCGCLPLMVCQV